MFDDLWADPTAQLVIWGATLAIAAVAVYYVVGKIRPGSAKKEPATSDLLSNCRELHSRGGLSEQEFRTIKTQLATRMEDELNERERTG